MAYTLELTSDDIETICFVGYRYGWSAILESECEAGVNTLAEHEAWEIKEAFESDTEGGHSFFPMLDQNSELAAKLYSFMEAIV